MKPLLFTFGLTYGGGVVSLVRPYTGFLVYVIFGIIKPDSLWFWAVPPGNYSRIVAIGFLLGWAIHGGGDWRFGRSGLILACLTGYWLVMLLTAGLAAQFPDLAWPQVEVMGKVVLPIIAGATLIDSVDKLQQLVWVIVLSQGYLAYEFNMQYFENPNFIGSEMGHGGLDNNGIAITMVTSVGMAFFLGLHATRPWLRILALACAGLMVHVVLITESRGGMLSLIVTGTCALILLPKKPGHMLLLALAVAGTLATSGENVQKRFMSAFASKEEGSDEGGGRLDFWKGCLKSMADTPLGVGPDQWPVTAPNYDLPARPAHSTWFQVGAELGIPGLACLLGFYLLTIGRLYPLIKDRYPVHDPWIRYAARMVMCSVAGFLVASQFVTIHLVELPYYVALVGASTLKIQSAPESGRYRADPSEVVPTGNPLVPEPQ